MSGNRWRGPRGGRQAEAMRRELQPARSAFGIPRGAPVLLLLGLGLAVPLARAQNMAAGPPSPVQMRVEVGAGGYLRAGVPIPVHVSLTNTGAAIVDGRIVVAFQGERTERSFALPRQGQQRYVLFIQRATPREAFPAAGELTVALYASRRRLTQQTVPLQLLRERDALILSLTDEQAGLVFLNENNAQEPIVRPWRGTRRVRRMRAAHLSPDAAPRHWAEWCPADVVVATGRAWAQLDAEQRRALRRWVDQGGQLIAAADLPSQWRDAEGASLLPVRPAGVRTSRVLPGLGTLAGEGLPILEPGGPIALVTGQPRPGARVLLGDGSGALVVQAPQARGWTAWLGLDPFQPLFRQWEGYPRFWRGLLHRLLDEGASGQQAGIPVEFEVAREAAQTLPPLKSPPIGVLAAFAVFYAAIFGPFNLWVLNRLRRTVRAWLFMPTLALVVAAAAVVVGRAWGQARCVANVVTLLETQSRARTAVGHTLVGIFSPTSRSFDVAVEDPAAEVVQLLPGGPADTPSGEEAALWPDTQDDATARYTRQPLLQYSQRLQRIRRVVDLGGGIEVTLTGAAGWVRNDSEFTLHGAAVFRLPGAAAPAGRPPEVRWQALPDLPPGETAPLRAADWRPWRRPDTAPENGGPADERQVFQARLRLLRERAPELVRDRNAFGPAAWLVAELQPPAGGVRITGVPSVSEGTLLFVRAP